MIAVVLVWQAAVWLFVCIIFGRSRASSIFHPFTYYLVFHGLVFVARPILEYAFGMETVFYLMRFYPTEGLFIFTLFLTTVAMLVFGVTSWWLAGGRPRLDRPLPAGFSATEWQAYTVLVILLGPVALYSALLGIRSAMPADTATEVIEMQRDATTGVIGFTNTTGYLVDAQLFLGTLCLMFIWGMRFRLWSFVPLLLYLANRAYIGWGRWTIVLTVAMAGLLFLADRKYRWVPAQFVILAIPVLVLFQQLGENRDTFKALVTGEPVQEDVLLANRSWIEKQDSPDFANFDFLTYVVDAVPEKSGTYSYFTQYLQLFTEPIPRILWSGKPYGPPILLVNFNDFGNFIGWTVSLVGDGWTSGGWLGVILTLGIVGYLTGRLHRWFWSGEASNFKILAYCTFVPLTLQWYRDGGISIAKFVHLSVGPVLMWWLLTRMLTVRRFGVAPLKRFIGRRPPAALPAQEG